MESLQAPPNNGSPNFGQGLQTMPTPATASEADGPGIMPSLASRMSDSMPPVGANDGDVKDSKLIG